MSLELIYDHYKDTFENIKSSLKIRDRLTLYILMLLFIVFLILISPALYSEALQSIAKQYLELETSPSHYLLVDLLIFACLLIVSVKYFQILIYIDREYSYIHSIEHCLKDLITEFKINREGEFYFEKRPLLQKYNKWIFSYLFIILIIIGAGAYWYRIFTYPLLNFTAKVFSSILLVLLLIYISLYLIWSFSKK